MGWGLLAGSALGAFGEATSSDQETFASRNVHGLDYANWNASASIRLLMALGPGPKPCTMHTPPVTSNESASSPSPNQ